ECHIRELRRELIEGLEAQVGPVVAREVAPEEDARALGDMALGQLLTKVAHHAVADDRGIDAKLPATIRGVICSYDDRPASAQHSFRHPATSERRAEGDDGGDAHPDGP